MRIRLKRVVIPTGEPPQPVPASESSAKAAPTAPSAMYADYVLFETDTGRTLALVIYQCELDKALPLQHPAVQAILDLGNRAALPVFFTRYSDDFSLWSVQPLNFVARKHLAHALVLSEMQWANLLFGLSVQAA